MFYQIIFSLQVKRCMITTYKQGIYELRHELPNDLRAGKRVTLFILYEDINDIIKIIK